MAPFPFEDPGGAAQVAPKWNPTFAFLWDLMAGPACRAYIKGQNTLRLETWQLNNQKNRGKQSGNEQAWEKKTGKEHRESCNQKSSEAMLLRCYP